MDWLSALEWRVSELPSRRLGRRPTEARAAVLVPLILRGAPRSEPPPPHDLELLLVLRSSDLARHPGQIAFPGGRVEASDEGSVDAALREAEEETGLPSQTVRILGVLPDQRTPTGWVITPVLGAISEPGRLQACPVEVAELIRLPVPALLGPAAFRRVTRATRDLLVHGDALVWRDRVIWGATARILLVLRRLLRPVIVDRSL